MRKLLLALSIAVATAAVVFEARLLMAPQPIDLEVRHDGLFGHETRRILSTTVLNLRAEGRLVVYSYKGAVQVQVERSTALGLIKGQRFLSVPAVVSYHLDLSDLGAEDVQLDEKSRTLIVLLPPLRLGEVAFAPEHAWVDNRGLLSFSDTAVQSLSRASYGIARRAFIAQAQQPQVANLARQQAERLVSEHFKLPLRAAGLRDIRVYAQFG